MSYHFVIFFSIVFLHLPLSSAVSGDSVSFHNDEADSFDKYVTRMMSMNKWLHPEYAKKRTTASYAESRASFPNKRTHLGEAMLGITTDQIDAIAEKVKTFQLNEKSHFDYYEYDEKRFEICRLVFAVQMIEWHQSVVVHKFCRYWLTQDMPSNISDPEPTEPSEIDSENDDDVLEAAFTKLKIDVDSDSTDSFTGETTSDDDDVNKTYSSNSLRGSIISDHSQSTES